MHTFCFRCWVRTTWLQQAQTNMVDDSGIGVQNFVPTNFVGPLSPHQWSYYVGAFIRKRQYLRSCDFFYRQVRSSCCGFDESASKSTSHSRTMCVLVTRMDKKCCRLQLQVPIVVQCLHLTKGFVGRLNLSMFDGWRTQWPTVAITLWKCTTSTHWLF